MSTVPFDRHGTAMRSQRGKAETAEKGRDVRREAC